MSFSAELKDFAAGFGQGVQTMSTIQRDNRAATWQKHQIDKDDANPYQGPYAGSQPSTDEPTPPNVEDPKAGVETGRPVSTAWPRNVDPDRTDYDPGNVSAPGKSAETTYERPGLKPKPITAPKVGGDTAGGPAVPTPPQRPAGGTQPTPATQAGRAAGAGAAAGVRAGATNVYAAYIRQAAERRGLDPNFAVEVSRRESSLNPKAYNGKGNDDSYGLFQLNRKGGLGLVAERAGINVKDPNTWQQQVDFALDNVVSGYRRGRDGWQPWSGATLARRAGFRPNDNARAPTQGGARQAVPRGAIPSPGGFSTKRPEPGGVVAYAQGGAIPDNFVGGFVLGSSVPSQAKKGSTYGSQTNAGEMEIYEWEDAVGKAGAMGQEGPAKPAAFAERPTYMDPKLYTPKQATADKAQVASVYNNAASGSGHGLVTLADGSVTTQDALEAATKAKPKTTAPAKPLVGTRNQVGPARQTANGTWTTFPVNHPDAPDYNGKNPGDWAPNPGNGYVPAGQKTTADATAAAGPYNQAGSGGPNMGAGVGSAGAGGPNMGGPANAGGNGGGTTSGTGGVIQTGDTYNAQGNPIAEAQAMGNSFGKDPPGKPSIVKGFNTTQLNRISDAELYGFIEQYYRAGTGGNRLGSNIQSLPGIGGTWQNDPRIATYDYNGMLAYAHSRLGDRLFEKATGSGQAASSQNLAQEAVRTNTMNQEGNSWMNRAEGGPIYGGMGYAEGGAVLEDYGVDPGMTRLQADPGAIPAPGEEEDLPYREGQGVPTGSPHQMEDLMNEPMTPEEEERLRTLFGQPPSGGADLPEEPPVRLTQDDPGQAQRYPSEYDRFMAGLPERNAGPPTGPPQGQQPLGHGRVPEFAEGGAVPGPGYADGGYVPIMRGGSEQQTPDPETPAMAQRRMVDRQRAYQIGLQPEDIDRAQSDPSRYGPYYGPGETKPTPKAKPKEKGKEKTPPLPPPRPKDEKPAPPLPPKRPKDDEKAPKGDTPYRRQPERSTYVGPDIEAEDPIKPRTDPEPEPLTPILRPRPDDAPAPPSLGRPPDDEEIKRRREAAAALPTPWSPVGGGSGAIPAPAPAPTPAPTPAPAPTTSEEVPLTPNYRTDIPPMPPSLGPRGAPVAPVPAPQAPQAAVPPPPLQPMNRPGPPGGGMGGPPDAAEIAKRTAAAQGLPSPQAPYPLGGSRPGTPPVPIPPPPRQLSPGMIKPGNIDLNARPKVNMPDGTVGTVLSFSIGTPQGEVLIPLVSDDGRIMEKQEAIDVFMKTGKMLGIFRDAAAANAYAEQLHRQQSKQYGGMAEGGSVGDTQARRDAQEATPQWWRDLYGRIYDDPTGGRPVFRGGK